jgi:hypothetical protein
MCLQPILAQRHTGWARAECIGGRTLLEHVELENGRMDYATIAQNAKYTMETSIPLMMDLGIITFDNTSRQFVPDEDRQISYATLAIMWQMRAKMWESITMGLCLADIIESFTKDVATRSIKLSDRQADELEPLVINFYIMISVLINRTAYDKDAPESLPLSQCTVVTMSPARIELLQQWQDRFAEVQAKIPDAWASELKDPVPPGTELDGQLLMCLNDRNHVHTLSMAAQQKMKYRIWLIGNVLKSMANCAWPESDHGDLLYHRTSMFIFKTAFMKLRYLNSELIREVINFDDVSSFSREKRTDGDGKTAFLKPAEAEKWKDNSSYEDYEVLPCTWKAALTRCVERGRETAAVTPEAEVVKEMFQESSRLVTIYAELQGGDRPLLELLVAPDLEGKLTTPAKLLAHMSELVQAAAAASVATRIKDADTQQLVKIDTLVWVCTTFLFKAGNVARFWMYLKTMYEHDGELLSEKAIKAWFAQPVAESSKRSEIAEDVLVTIHANCKDFLVWLDEDDEESEEESEEEDE